MENVFWLGGSPCAGKSSIGEILANRFDLDLYHVDDAFEIHAQRFDLICHPTLRNWFESSWNQRWMKPIATLVQDVIACYGEHFTLILADILSRPKDKPLLVEGSALLPGEVNSVLTNRSHAAWVVATADFQLKHYARRKWVNDILQQCDDSEAAFQNWMERDIHFARWVIEEAKALDSYLLVVDGQQTIKESASLVAAHFGFGA